MSTKSIADSALRIATKAIKQSVVRIVRMDKPFTIGSNKFWPQEEIPVNDLLLSVLDHLDLKVEHANQSEQVRFKLVKKDD